MSDLIRLSIHAQGCNAQPADLVYGPPSPLSVYLAMRAWMLKAGLGEVRGLAVALQGFSRDPGRLGARPLQTYGDPAQAKTPPLFDEFRADLWLDVAVRVSSRLADTDLSDLVAQWTALPFLGGVVHRVQAQTWRQKEDLIAPWTASHWLMTDATASVRLWQATLAGRPTWETCAQTILTSHLSQADQQAVDTALGIDADLRRLANQRRLRLMPLGYRRLSPWAHPPGARTGWRDGQPIALPHAYAEAIYGATHWRRMGRPVLTDGTPWWWVPRVASSTTSPVVFHLEGVSDVQ